MSSSINEPCGRIENCPDGAPPLESCAEVEVKLSRWLVSFASGTKWYSVGEYVALDAASAIERAVEIFGSASDYRAEEIPWDAAPLLKTRVAAHGERGT